MVIVTGKMDANPCSWSTGCEFGRKEWDKVIFYAITNGGTAGPVDGVVVGGKIAGFVLPGI